MTGSKTAHVVPSLKISGVSPDDMQIVVQQLAKYLRAKEESVEIAHLKGNVFAINDKVCIKFTQLKREQMVLAQMHEADPKRTVRPLFAIFNPEGNMICYATERVETTLADLAQWREFKNFVQNQIRVANKHYQNAGLPQHEDLNWGNIGINIAGRKVPAVKLMDPFTGDYVSLISGS